MTMQMNNQNGGPRPQGTPTQPGYGQPMHTSSPGQQGSAINSPAMVSGQPYMPPGPASRPPAQFNAPGAMPSGVPPRGPFQAPPHAGPPHRPGFPQPSGAPPMPGGNFAYPTASPAMSGVKSAPIGSPASPNRPILPNPNQPRSPAMSQLRPAMQRPAFPPQDAQAQQSTYNPPPPTHPAGPMPGARPAFGGAPPRPGFSPQMNQPTPAPPNLQQPMPSQAPVGFPPGGPPRPGMPTMRPMGTPDMQSASTPPSQPFMPNRQMMRPEIRPPMQGGMPGPPPPMQGPPGVPAQVPMQGSPMAAPPQASGGYSSMGGGGMGQPMPGQPMQGGYQGGMQGQPMQGQPMQGGYQGGMPGQPMQPGMQQFDKQAQLLAEQMETLQLGPAAPMPGQPANAAQGADSSSFPRPLGLHTMEPTPPADSRNCSQEYMRVTLNAVPQSEVLRRRWPLPLGILITPMSQKGPDVPVVELSEAGIIRCRKCRTYVNPHVDWLDGGRRFKCNVCGAVTEVPAEYMSPLGGHAGVNQRPELSMGTVEYVAPAEYMVRAPIPPQFLFCIDVSQAAIQSGMVSTACAAIKSCLTDLPGDNRTRVGIITFDTTIHHYAFRPGSSCASMLVVGELDEPFLPQPDDLMPNVSEHMDAIASLLDALPSFFTDTMEQQTAFGPALQASYLVMSGLGGKLVTFLATPPSLGAGHIKNRDNVSLYNTDRECTLRQADDQFFKKFAGECSRAQISVDLFSFTRQYTDLASLVTIPRYTCGQVYYFPGFTQAVDHAKLSAEITRNLTRETGWEAVMRIRCSKGLRIGSFHGHFFIRSTDLLALPTIDPDKTFAVQMHLDESTITDQTAYIQCALLYTASCGERRIRVHTLALPVVQELRDMFSAADPGAIAALLGKLSVEKSYQARLDEARQQLENKIAASLREFRLATGAAARQPNKLSIPKHIRLVPAWALGLRKCVALKGGKGGEVQPDERIAVGFDMMQCSPQQILFMAYPFMCALHDLSGNWGKQVPQGEQMELPQALPLTMSVIDPTGVYLIDNGRMLIVYVGANAPADLLSALFNTEASKLPADLMECSVETSTPVSELSVRVNGLIKSLRGMRPNYQNCYVVQQGGRADGMMASFFVEDRQGNQPGYVDFLNSLLRTSSQSKQ